MSNQNQWLPSQGDVIAGRYRLDDEIGSGGFAVAWLATDRNTGATVVVKPTNLRASNQNPANKVKSGFQQEIDLLKELQSPSGHGRIMTLLDDTTHKGLTFSVIEYIDGETLEDKYDSRTADPDTARQVGMTLADILSFIHENEIVYRDLKPDNVMETGSGEIKLIDLNAATGDEGNTVFGNHPMYPPEMTGSDISTDTVGPHTDVYTIGKFLFWLLAGSVPRQDGKRPSEMGQNCPGWLDEIIATATAGPTQDRYNNAIILGRALQERDPEPPDTAEIERVQGTGTHQISPGDPLGRADANITPAVPSRDDGQCVSAVQVKFDADRTGQWYIEDESTNGTYVNKGDGQGWQLVLSDRGKRKLRQRGHDFDENAPSQLEIDDGDLVALVDPKYGLSFRFRNL
jgi:protein kinase/serine/threonine-protein kinase